jgi:hypothetical protein
MDISLGEWGSKVGVVAKFDDGNCCAEGANGEGRERWCGWRWPLRLGGRGTVDVLDGIEELVLFLGAEGELGLETSGEDVSSSPLRSILSLALLTAWFRSPPRLFFANKADNLGA